MREATGVSGPEPCLGLPFPLTSPTLRYAEDPSVGRGCSRIHIFITEEGSRVRLELPFTAGDRTEQPYPEPSPPALVLGGAVGTLGCHTTALFLAFGEQWPGLGLQPSNIRDTNF